MVPHRELMALCRAVMCQSCRTCVEFSKCQCSPSVYVPCNLVISLSCCTREQVIHQKRNIIHYPFALWSKFLSSTFWFQNRNWKEFWGCEIVRTWPLCFGPQPVPTELFLLKRSLFSRHWTISGSNHKLQINCIADQDAFLSELSSNLA